MPLATMLQPFPARRGGGGRGGEALGGLLAGPEWNLHPLQGAGGRAGGQGGSGFTHP